MTNGFAEQSTPPALSPLFTANQTWAADIARRHHRKIPPSFDVDDLIQIAWIEMDKQTHLYNPAKNNNFQGYAYRAVLGAVQMATRRRHFRNATAEPLDRPEVTKAVRSQSEAQQEADQETQRREWREARRMRLLKSKLRRLQPEEAQLARLVFIEGQTILTAAASMNLDERTAKRLLRTAVKGLKGREDRPSVGALRLLRLLEQKAGAIPSQEHLARLLKCPTRTVQRRIQDLKARGLLSSRQAGNRNVYVVKGGDSKMSSKKKAAEISKVEMDSNGISRTAQGSA